ncbi:MAG TPA: DUF6455 family protein [Rhodocyclaceae bacterium]|nr:DUF6455 family protein [Rhodocyclaceae bacterium]
MNPINRWIAHTDTRMALMRRMLARFAADAGAMAASDIDPTLRSALSRCRACSAEDVCRHWLDGTGHTSEASSFCPNADTFTRVRDGRAVDA